MSNKLLYLVAALGGVLLAMCYPGFEVASELVWVWSVPVLVALWLNPEASLKSGMKIGLAAGLGFWLVNVKWIIAMGELPTVPLAGAILGWLTLSVYLSLYVAVWGGFVSAVANPWLKREGPVASSKIQEKVQQKMGEKKLGLLSKLSPSFCVIGYAVVVAAAWVVLEFLRTWVFTGFAWNGVGVAFHDVPVMMQAADLVGVTGLSFVPVFFGAVVVQTGRRLWHELRAGRFQLHLEIGVLVLVLAAFFAYGVQCLSYYAAAPSKEFSTVIVQQNIKQSMKWDERLEAQHYLEYIEAIDEAMLEVERHNVDRLHQAVDSGAVVEFDRVDLLVLPESAMTQPLVYLDGDTSKIYFPMLTKDSLVDNILERHSCHVVFGSNLMSGINEEDGIYYDPDGDAYNAFLIAKPDLPEHSIHPTEQIAVYGKNHLVPFGEYLPAIPFLAEIMEVLSGMPYGKNFSRSGSTEPLQIDLTGQPLQVIPTVCYEDTVGRLTRKFVRQTDQVIINITNDGWFGESEGAIQHLVNAKFRAVELRRPLVRSANTGVSGVVDVTGSMWRDGDYLGIGKPDDPFVQGNLFANVQLLEEPATTWYALFGDWFVGVCAIVMLLGGAFLLSLRLK
ncbi:apolipoprotein N-acyltransferase [Rubritalea marina]|uniref:apolipoprotein N-acyltransferase n=1 Tax=Rubritalea marina TaxID=361055 RepID=UPI00037BE901|nr:apolipoprotein N-acyltransferase [Rubritalea marina]